MSITKADLIEALKHFTYGSQGAQLQQKTGTYELLTEDTAAHIREALREELPQTMRTIRFNGDYANLFGFGDNIYIGTALGKVPTVGRPETSFILYKMSPGGVLEGLLTWQQANALTGITLWEVSTILEAPDGTLFCSTHPEPAHILRKKVGGAWASVYSDATMRSIYGIVMNAYGDIFAVLRGPAAIGGPHRSIIRSQDGGDTWATVWSDANDWIFRIKAHGDTVIAGGQNIIVRSANRGAAWATTVAVGDVRSVEQLKKGFWIAISTAAGRHYYVSLDDGATWISPVNRIPFSLGYENCSYVSPEGELYITCSDEQLSIARTHNFSKWNVCGVIYEGVWSRGIYVTGSHIYIGGSITSGPYWQVKDNGVIFIIPISTVKSWSEKETHLLHNAVNCTTDNHDYNSSPVICKSGRKFLLEYAITENGTIVDGDRLIFKVEFSDNCVTWYPYQNGPFGYLAEEESTTPCNKSVSGDCDGEWVRVTVTTDYTNANPLANYFTVTTKLTVLED